MSLKFIFIFLLITITIYTQTLDSRVISRERKIIIENENDVRVIEKSTTLIARKSDFYLGYESFRETDFRKLSDMNAGIYDILGNELKELEDEDIKESTVSYYSLYDEHKTISHQLNYPVLPYIIKKELEYKLESTFFLPDWDPQEKAPVESAKLEIVLEHPIMFSYRNIGDINEPQITLDARGNKCYCWELSDIPEYEDEYRNAPEARHQLGVKLQAVKFDLNGFKGTADNWSNFGSWVHNLFKDQLLFSPGKEYGQEYLSLTDKRERIKKIYRYLQDNTRYVQVYLGIDGWRPHNVNSIHSLKYGDCKDLSAYMVAMLRQAGIDAYPALALTRNAGIVEVDFPGNHFNHCIVVVPIDKDTLFLECTSDVTSIDELPDQIEGINLLLIKPENSTLITTPVSTPHMNQCVLEADAKINPDRSLTIKGTIKYTGNPANDIRYFLIDKTRKELQEWLARKLSRKSGDVIINELSVFHLKEPDSTLSVTFGAELKYFATKAGNRLIFDPGLFHEIYFEGEKPDERKMSLLNYSTSSNSEKIIFSFPEEFELKNPTLCDNLISPFGSYSKNSELRNNSLVWRNNFTISERYIPLENYAEYYNFMEGCKLKSQTKFVLVEK